MKKETSYHAALFVVEKRPIETLISLTRSSLEGPDRDVFFERDQDGRWQALRASEARERIARIAMGLRTAGIRTGDRVALMSPNRVDWLIVNIAITHAGAVSVPIYATQAHDQVAHILADSDARLLVIETAPARQALLDDGVALPDTITIDGGGSGSLAALEAAGASALAADPGALDAIADTIRPDDLAVLIYTSGTTGTPKGVMLSHRNITSNAMAGWARVSHAIAEGDPVLSVLPFAHIYEAANVYGYLMLKLTVYVNRRIDSLLDDLRTVRPIACMAVPRIFEKMLVAIVSRAKAQGGVRAKIVPWALATGREYQRAKAAGRAITSSLKLQYALAHVLALKKLRTLLGLDRLIFFGSGSAPLHPDVQLTLLGFDVTILEGYGLTECSPVVSVNTLDANMIGSVGPAIDEIALRLADDGELLVRGPGVMLGYYNDAAATAAVIDGDGWFHTGDIATIDGDGIVRITDRKRELFKTSGGKFIAPSRVESAIMRSIYINQVMVFGNGRAHPAALVSPNWVNLRKELDLPDFETTDDLSQRPDVAAFMQREVMEQTADLGGFEQIRWVGVLPRDLTVEDGELSPTLKIKRRVVEARYTTLIENVYAMHA